MRMMREMFWLRPGYMFPEFAYAEAELGHLEMALTLLSEGKAKLLAGALRQQSLNLPAEKEGTLSYSKMRSGRRQGWLSTPVLRALAPSNI